MDGDMTWGGEDTMQCTDDVLQICAPDPCMCLLTSVIPINSKEREKKT